MNAGILKETITILQPRTTVNEYGEQVQMYIDKFTTRARVDWNGGNRNITNDEVLYNYQRTFHMRFYHTVSEFDVVLWQGKKYRIINIERIREYNEQIITTELINE